MGSSPEMLPPRLQDVTEALLNLRRAWPGQWPGLPLVFDRAWSQLGMETPRKGSAAHRLLAFGRLVSAQVEEDGVRRHALDREPAYHNRLHIADTLVCMTYLLKTSAALHVPGARKPSVAAMALGIMAAHDFLHPGGSNAQPGEFEARAVQDLQPLMAATGLSLAERQTLEFVIMATDPARVKGVHMQVRLQSYALGLSQCLAVLVQEADILASTLPQTSTGLTRSLATEWAPKQPDAANKLLLPQNRLLFLEHAALFSSPAAIHLGLDAVKLRQVKRLEEKLKLNPKQIKPFKSASRFTQLP